MTAISFSVVPSLWAFWRSPAFVVTNLRIQRRHQHQGIVDMLFDIGLNGFDPTAHLSLNETQPSPRWAGAVEEIIDHHGFGTRSVQNDRWPTDIDGNIVAHHLCGDHRQCFALVGFTLPGMMEEPGSLSGMKISPMPLRGPEEASGYRWRSSSG